MKKYNQNNRKKAKFSKLPGRMKRAKVTEGQQHVALLGGKYRPHVP